MAILVGLSGFLSGPGAQAAFNAGTTRVSERLSTEDGNDYGINITCFLQDSQGYLWFGSQSGLARYDGYNVRVYRHESGNLSSMVDAGVQSLWEDRQGVLWVGTSRGLERFDRATGTFSHFLPDPLAPADDWRNVINDLREDNRGILWVGGRGLRSFDRLTGEFKLVRDVDRTKDGKFHGGVDAIFEDSFGDLWVGGAAAFGKLDRSSGSYTLYRLGEHSPKGVPPEPSGSQWVQEIYEAGSGILWLGTSRGPVAFDRKTGKFKPYRIYPAAAESSSVHSVSSIVEDDAGVLWIGTWGGGCLTYNPGADCFEPFSLDTISFSRRISALYKDNAGTIWVGTSEDGVLKVMSLVAGAGQNRYIPPVVITSFKAFDVPVPLNGTSDRTRPIELSYRDNVFSVEFAALNYIHSEENRYAYMLEGYDTSWVYCGRARRATYINVQPGSYVFRVKGSNNEGVWNEEGTSLAIVIAPPWWKTTIFSFLLWAAIVGALAGAALYYERSRIRQRVAVLEREHALERERARIAQDMHDEVGSTLSEIAILSELAKKRPAEAGRRVQEIKERTAELIDNVSEIVWAMNPENDSLDDLLGHGRFYVVKYLDRAGIACRFLAPETVPTGSLSAEAKRDIFLVVKEALHNVVKHAAASEVKFSVDISGNTVKITIQDNGRGFVPGEERSGGNGLENMKQRMAGAGGTFDIQARPGCGTTVVLTIEIPAA